MSNVVEFRGKPSPTAAPDFSVRVNGLLLFATSAERRVRGARSMDTLLRHYTDWLRRYHEMNGAIGSAFTRMEKELRVHGNEDECDQLDAIVEFMASVEDVVKGPHPWLSLPNFARTKLACVSAMQDCKGNLTNSVMKASYLARIRQPAGRA